MADIYENLKDEILKSEDNLMLTENGAVVYKSFGNAMVDFEFSINSLRNASEEEIQEKILKAYAENPEYTARMIFQIGDVREGKGERHTFDACIDFLAKDHPEILKELMPLIPEYTRWDRLIRLCSSENKSVATYAKQLVVEQIKKDKESVDAGKDNISLCAKWMPSIQSKKDADRKIALKLEKALGVDHKGYRKLLSELRGKLNIIEKQMSQGRFEDIDPSKMTSKQMLKYSKKMEEKNAEAFREYLEKVESGEAKMNAKVLTPADVVHKYYDGDYCDELDEKDDAIELMWKNLKDTIGDTAISTIVVRDGSGSMTEQISRKSKMTCLQVATALSIYCAEKMPESLRDKFITFSSTPEIIDMSHLDSLHDKLALCDTYDDCSNTDLKKTFDLLLKTLVNNNISQEDAPKSILILSDMEFDYATTEYYYNKEEAKPLFDKIREEWDEKGYKLPTLIFWQLNVKRSPVPEINNELGLVCVSGYTTDNLNLVLSGKLAEYTPEEQLALILSSERYDKVSEAFNIGLEKEMNNKGLDIEEFANNVKIEKSKGRIKEEMEI